MPAKTEIYTKPAADLLPLCAEYNPRQMSASEMAKLKKSLKAFGFLTPVIFNVTTNRVVGGHQRIKAAAELEMDVPVREVEITETEEKLLNVALNRIHGNFEAAKLNDLVTELQANAADLDLEAIGMDAADIEELRTSLVKPTVDGEEERPEFVQMVVKVTRSDAAAIREALKAAKLKSAALFKENIEAVTEKENANGNGNALVAIAEWWLKNRENAVVSEETEKPQ